MIDYLRELNFVSIALRLLLSAVIGFSLGMERGRKRRPAGCRTYMLVCMGATLTLLLSQYEYYMLTHDWYDLALEVGIRTDVSRFGAQVIIAYRFFLVNRLSGQRCRSADGQQVHRVVLHDGFRHLRRPPPLADHALQPVLQQGGGVGIHAVAAGGTRRADDLPGARRRGANIVDRLALQREGDRLSGGQAGGQPLVGGVAAGIEPAGEQHLISGAERGDGLRGQG